MKKDKNTKAGRSNCASIVSRMYVAALLCGFANTVIARDPAGIPEPSSLSLIGASIVAAIVYWRIRGGK